MLSRYRKSTIHGRFYQTNVHLCENLSDIFSAGSVIRLEFLDFSAV